MDQASSALFVGIPSRWLDSRRGVVRPGVRGEEVTLDVRLRGRGEGRGDGCADEGRGLGHGGDATMLPSPWSSGHCSMYARGVREGTWRLCRNPWLRCCLHAIVYTALSRPGGSGNT